MKVGAVGLVLAGAVAAVLAAPGTGGGRRVAETAFVRVNQVGYPAAAPKRAYLISSAP